MERRIEPTQVGGCQVPSFAAFRAASQLWCMLGMARGIGGVAFVLVVAFIRDVRADPSTARVHITSEMPVALERRGSLADEWHPQCISPCDRDLSRDGEYRAVFRTGLAPGPPFQLEASAGGSVELKIEPPSKGKKIAGMAMIGVGAPLAVGGGIGAVALLAASANSSSAYSGIGYGLGVISGLIGLIGTGVLLGGFGLVSGAEAQTTQVPTPSRAAFVREPPAVPGGVAPRVEAQSKPTVFVPLSFSF